MEPSCVRQTSIPGTSKLFGDFLYHFDRVQQYFPWYFGNFEDLQRSAKTVVFPESRRAEIVRALRTQNPTSTALDQLEKPGTVAVVTGQQVGLLSGPSYTVFKALTAVRVAAHLTKEGTPAVPVFWLATEDHDLAEVDHAWLFDVTGAPLKVSAQGGSIANSPVGTVEIAQLDLTELSKALGGFLFGSAVVDRVEQYYRPGNSFGRAFHDLVREILTGFDLIYLDPLAPEIRRLCAPFLGEVVERVPELIAELRRRSSALEAAGYHAQVYLDGDASLLFSLENGKRVALKYKDGRFTSKDRAVDSAELAAHAESLSPNALLRPVMQDYLLPTVSYVGGPSEIAYMAQSQVLYERLLGRMPVLYPRHSFTLLDDRATKLLDRYGIHVLDLLDSQDRVKAVIANKLVPHDLRGELGAIRSGMTASLSGFREKLLQFDPTLSAATDKSIAKISYQLDKLTAKTARETMRRDHRAGGDAQYLSNLIYPHRHLQERFYSILPFLAKHGLDLPQRIYGETQVSCPDHMVRTF
ncbi:MAG: bacillithiol biosynthesis cysteine-adding enzyme BshC [Bryobacteraceae bacterium]